MNIIQIHIITINIPKLYCQRFPYQIQYFDCCKVFIKYDHVTSTQINIGRWFLHRELYHFNQITLNYISLFHIKEVRWFISLFQRWIYILVKYFIESMIFVWAEIKKSNSNLFLVPIPVWSSLFLVSIFFYDCESANYIKSVEADLFDKVCLGMFSLIIVWYTNWPTVKVMAFCKSKHRYRNLFTWLFTFHPVT